MCGPAIRAFLCTLHSASFGHHSLSSLYFFPIDRRLGFSAYPPIRTRPLPQQVNIQLRNWFRPLSLGHLPGFPNAGRARTLPTYTWTRTQSNSLFSKYTIGSIAGWACLPPGTNTIAIHGPREWKNPNEAAETRVPSNRSSRALSLRSTPDRSGPLPRDLFEDLRDLFHAVWRSTQGILSW